MSLTDYPNHHLHCDGDACESEYPGAGELGFRHPSDLRDAAHRAGWRSVMENDLCPECLESGGMTADRDPSPVLPSDRLARIPQPVTQKARLRELEEEANRPEVGVGG